MDTGIRRYYFSQIEIFTTLQIFFLLYQKNHISTMHRTYSANSVYSVLKMIIF